MLGKLFKHEMQETAKLLLPLCLIVIAATLLGAVFIQTGLFENPHLTTIAAIYMILYVFSIFALFILSAIYLMIRFYKTMYSSQGYLTHTLPVSSFAVLNTKILSALIWLISVSAICILSVMTLVFNAAGYPDSASINNIIDGISTVFNLPFAAAACLIVVAVLIFYLSAILMIYTCFSIGQLFGQYRIPAAIVAYVVLYIIQQIVSLVSLFIFGITVFDNVNIEQSDIFYRHIMLLLVTEAAVFSAAYYSICQYITKKKLNLE